MLDAASAGTIKFLLPAKTYRLYMHIYACAHESQIYTKFRLMPACLTINAAIIYLM